MNGSTTHVNGTKIACNSLWGFDHKPPSGARHTLSKAKPCTPATTLHVLCDGASWVGLRNYKSQTGPASRDTRPSAVKCSRLQNPGQGSRGTVHVLSVSPTSGSGKLRSLEGAEKTPKGPRRSVWRSRRKSGHQGSEDGQQEGLRDSRRRRVQIKASRFGRTLIC